MNSSAKRLPILAHAEDSLSADPSPKKKKTTDSNKENDHTKNNRLSYLEERFASPDIRFIDSQSPEHVIIVIIFYLFRLKNILIFVLDDCCCGHTYRM